MARIQQIELKEKLITLLGFAKKSRQLICGYEGVRRGVSRNTIVFIVIDNELAEHTKEKIHHLARRQGIPVYSAKPIKNGVKLVDTTGYKVVGMSRGGLADGFMSTLKQES